MNVDDILFALRHSFAAIFTIERRPAQNCSKHISKELISIRVRVIKQTAGMLASASRNLSPTRQEHKCRLTASLTLRDQ